MEPYVNLGRCKFCKNPIWADGKYLPTTAEMKRAMTVLFLSQWRERVPNFLHCLRASNFLLVHASFRCSIWFCSISLTGRAGFFAARTSRCEYSVLFEEISLRFHECLTMHDFVVTKGQIFLLAGTLPFLRTRGCWFCSRCYHGQISFSPISLKQWIKFFAALASADSSAATCFISILSRASLILFQFVEPVHIFTTPCASSKSTNFIALRSRALLCSIYCLKFSDTKLFWLRWRPSTVFYLLRDSSCSILLCPLAKLFFASNLFFSHSFRRSLSSDEEELDLFLQQNLTEFGSCKRIWARRKLDR